MAQVRGTNTKPELLVRSVLHRLGYRFRLHRPDLPGKPDVVLPRYRTVVFVNGCFWHQHRGCRRAKRPETRREFWDRKLDGNIGRDARNYDLLRQRGWHVIVVWTCEVTSPSQLAERLALDLAARGIPG